MPIASILFITLFVLFHWISWVFWVLLAVGLIKLILLFGKQVCYQELVIDYSCQNNLFALEFIEIFPTSNRSKFRLIHFHSFRCSKNAQGITSIWINSTTKNKHLIFNLGKKKSNDKVELYFKEFSKRQGEVDLKPTGK